jgi:hypothetical protein
LCWSFKRFVVGVGVILLLVWDWPNLILLDPWPIKMSMVGLDWI